MQVSEGDIYVYQLINFLSLEEPSVSIFFFKMRCVSFVHLQWFL
jgi:hypothetical protein